MSNRRARPMPACCHDAISSNPPFSQNCFAIKRSPAPQSRGSSNHTGPTTIKQPKSSPPFTRGSGEPQAERSSWLPDWLTNPGYSCATAPDSHRLLLEPTHPGVWELNQWQQIKLLENRNPKLLYLFLTGCQIDNVRLVPRASCPYRWERQTPDRFLPPS